ncbi:AEC family transporter [Thalassobaculum salexigens]|uniref:AEC family transporter n=1 Tax=Thalassobaculum salexigens TaxID=455360 RepID=UPI00248D3F96|nr:AEC family transporter [Thalassobaculum salexigens]
MEILLEIIVPVFGIVALGYGAARTGLFPHDATKGLSRFVFDYAIPAMLFRTMATTELPATIQWGFLISYFGGGYIAWIVGSLLNRYAFKGSGAAPAIAGMTGAFSNTVMLGVPLVLTTFGDEATLPLFLIIAFHSWQLLSVVTIQAEIGIGARQEMRRLPVNVAKGLITNPIIIALLLGVLVNLLGFKLPGFVDTLTSTLGRAALPCAVFAMGASIAAYRIAGAVQQAAVGTVLKLALHPLLVWALATHVFRVETLWRDVAVLLASLPVGINVYLMAQRYQSAVAQSTTAILISTGLSVLSVAGVLLLLDVR